MLVEISDLYWFYDGLSKKTAFYCVDTGECFYEDEDMYTQFKDILSFIEVPKSGNLSDNKKFISLSEDPAMLKLLDISDHAEFARAFHGYVNDFGLFDLWCDYAKLFRKRELVNWCNIHGLEWVDNHLTEQDAEIDTIDFPEEIRKALEKNDDNTNIHG